MFVPVRVRGISFSVGGMPAAGHRGHPPVQDFLAWHQRLQPRPPYSFECASPLYYPPPTMARLRLTTFSSSAGYGRSGPGPDIMPDLSRVRGLANVVGALEPAKQLSALLFCIHEGIDTVGMVVWAGAEPAFLEATGIRPCTVAARFVRNALLAAAHINPNHGRFLAGQAGACDGALPGSVETRCSPFHGPTPTSPEMSVMWSARPTAAPASLYLSPHDISVQLRVTPHRAPACEVKRAGALDRELACDEESTMATTGPNGNDGSRRRCRRGRRGAGARGYSEC